MNSRHCDRRNIFHKIIYVITVTMALGVYHKLSDNFYRPSMRNFVQNNITPTEITRDQTYDSSTQKLLVLIVAYMHTGSSFTGSILQQHPGTFYEYEPLRSLQSDTRANRPVMYLNGTARRYHGELLDPSVAAEAVDNLLHCNHENLDIASVTMEHQGVHSRINRDRTRFLVCNRRIRGHHKTFRSPTPAEAMRRCLPILKEKCNAAKYVVNKYIRLSMKSVQKLLPKYENMKVIHLVRDPRAMMDSQARKNDMGSRIFTHFNKNTKQMCTRMNADLELADELKASYPGKILSIRYEDLTSNPVKETLKMFDFLGISFNQQDIRYVNKSMAPSTVWRHHISERNLRTVDTHCSRVYHALGYIQHGISQIRNVSDPTYHSPLITS